VTAAWVGRPAPELAPAREGGSPGPVRAGRAGRLGRAGRSRRPGRAGLRLVRLHAASRQVLACLLVLAVCAAALRTALHWLPHTGVLSRQIPLTIEAGAAAVIGVTTRSPFGEPERATGRWLPWLRLALPVALTGAAMGALAAGSASAHLAYGCVGLLRDVAGFTGIALLAAAVLGGALSWIGPIAYLGITLAALTGHWATPWVWPARPPHDRGAAICAALVFAAGVAVITARGARDSTRE
jgi:hypothetical protein